MTDFVFRNLSVRLAPSGGGSQDCRDNTSAPPFCAPCSDVPSHCACTGFTHIEPETLNTTGQCFDAVTQPVFSCHDGPAELAVLKESLRNQLARVDDRLQQLATEARPRSVEEIDALKAQLLDAVTELDERREQVDRGGPARG